MGERSSWIDGLRRRLVRWSDRGIGQSWLVAVSGGSDSVGLLRLLHQFSEPLGLRLSVAHLDHGVRGDEARADAEFVGALAESLGLPFYLGQWQPTRTAHFEADARQARYGWLMEVAKGPAAANVIATGHTRDDQAETILHRILRGTGLRGLSGIPAHRVLCSHPRLRLVRPVLCVSRGEIRDYLGSLNQAFREDKSNSDPSRTRARIRQDLLPKLAAEYNPGVVDALVRLGSMASAFERELDADTFKLEKLVVVSRVNDCIVIKHGALRSLPAMQRTAVLRRVWRNAGWPEASMSQQRWHRLAALVKSDEFRPVEVGARVEVSTDRLFLVLRRRPGPGSTSADAVVDAPKPISLAVPGLTAVPWARGSIDARLVPASDPDATFDETVDLDQIVPPVTVRTPTAGDRFAPLGMRGQSMPLADFLRGRQVRRTERERVPLVCDRNGSIWVVGHRIAERVRVSEKTERRLGLRWICVDQAEARQGV